MPWQDLKTNAQNLTWGQIIINKGCNPMSQKCLIFLYKVHPHVKWPEKKT